MNINEAEDKMYNLSQLNQIARGNTLLLKKILETFIRQVSTTVGQIESSYSAGSLAEVALLAHSIKPNIDSLNIVALMDVIRSIETGAKNADPSNLARDILTLKTGIAQVTRQLQQNELN